MTQLGRGSDSESEPELEEEGRWRVQGRMTIKGRHAVGVNGDNYDDEKYAPHPP